jgi:hypothetical protein
MIDEGFVFGAVASRKREENISVPNGQGKNYLKKISLFWVGEKHP